MLDTLSLNNITMEVVPGHVSRPSNRMTSTSQARPAFGLRCSEATAALGSEWTSHGSLNYASIQPGESRVARQE